LQDSFFHAIGAAKPRTDSLGAKTMAAKTTISGLFGRSPIKPLQEHMTIVTNSAQKVSDLFECLCTDDCDKSQAIIDEIFKLESEADLKKNQLRAHLPRSYFMPVDRRDILEILDLQDEIADTAQDIAGLVQERRMVVPPSLQEPLLNLVRRCIDACTHCDKIINELDELVATGFRGRESDAVTYMVELFALEDEMKPVSVILWYELIRMIGSLADYAEKVGNRLRLLLAR
jgi:predicted phosphate transport protein (TIGR00153 family)